MTSVKAVSIGVKWIQCERDIRGKNSPVCYIPEQDPMQDALKKSKKTIYLKLILLHTGNKLKVVIWVSGTPVKLLLHVCKAIHA